MKVQSEAVDEDEAGKGRELVAPGKVQGDLDILNLVSCIGFEGRELGAA